MNTIGDKIRLTTFGESHGQAIGGVIDGYPAGIEINMDSVRTMLARRRPGQSDLTTPRNEADTPDFLSGISPEGISLGSPIAFIIKNNDTREADYSEMKSIFRPSHADFTYQQKYGIRDWRGGGRASARETAVRVVAGSLCSQLPELKNVRVLSAIQSVGTLTDKNLLSDLLAGSRTPRLCNTPGFIDDVHNLVRETKKAGDSIGGIIACAVFGLPVGVGNPIYDKLSSRLASAMFSINAVKGFDLGAGFKIAEGLGSQMNDPFIPDPVNDGNIITSTNNSGGVQGGISNGMPVFFRVAFKPTPTIMQPQTSVNVNSEPCELNAAGRHDPCVTLRALPIVEAMTWLTIANLI